MTPDRLVRVESTDDYAIETAVLRLSARRSPTTGPVAQLGARLNGIQEVTGSIPVRSTKFSFDPSSGLKYSKREDVTTVRLSAFPLSATPSEKKQSLKPLPLLQRRLYPEIRGTR